MKYWFSENKDIKLYQGDCLEVMDKLIELGVRVDAIIVDLPYGNDKTRAKWDNIIPFDKMWNSINKLSNKNIAKVFFGNEPFSSNLRLSNIKQYKYDLKWIKNRATGFANANYRPMNKYEDIIVFSEGNASTGGKANPMKYFPQGLLECNKTKKNHKNRHGLISNDTNNTSENNSLLDDTTTYIQKFTNYPCNILEFNCEKKYVHPTQKPVELLEYLIKTYTNEGDLVLDFTMGSGSTGVACKNLNRKFIGIELDEKYFDIAVERIKGE